MGLHSSVTMSFFKVLFYRVEKKDAAEERGGFTTLGSDNDKFSRFIFSCERFRRSCLNTAKFYQKKVSVKN